MKIINQILIPLFVLFFLSTNETFAQYVKDTTTTQSSKIYVVVKNDGTQFIGKILSQDAREVLIDTKNMGQVIIPKHEIKEIRELKGGELSSSGEYIPVDAFSTRYFITTNGFPIKKGESYILWNWLGPDFQFGVGENIGIGIMTSWFAVPIIGSAKFSMPLGENVNLGIGTLLGTASWAAPDLGIALPFGALTFGDRKTNITFSGGYGAFFYKGNTDGSVLASVSGMAKVGEKVSLVFDSFILPAQSGNQSDFAILIPGIRLKMGNNTAFQFGFAAVKFGKEFVPMPIPMVQLYRKL